MREDKRIYCNRIMENKSTNAEDLKFKSKIKDWGLSHTTLEEVFMKVIVASLFYANFL